MMKTVGQFHPVSTVGHSLPAAWYKWLRDGISGGFFRSVSGYDLHSGNKWPV